MPVADDDSDVALIAPDAVPELAIPVGRNLRRLTTRHGYSLEHLAKVSGVSRGMASQIELGRSTLAIGLLWKIANALGVIFANPHLDDRSRRHDGAAAVS